MQAFSFYQDGVLPKKFLYQPVLYVIWHRDGKFWGAFHFSGYSVFSPYIARPGTTGNPIVHVPEQHAFSADAGLWATVQHHAKATVYHLAPANTTAVVE